MTRIMFATAGSRRALRRAFTSRRHPASRTSTRSYTRTTMGGLPAGRQWGGISAITRSTGRRSVWVAEDVAAAAVARDHRWGRSQLDDPARSPHSCPISHAGRQLHHRREGRSISTATAPARWSRPRCAEPAAVPACLQLRLARTADGVRGWGRARTRTTCGIDSEWGTRSRTTRRREDRTRGIQAG